MNERVTTIKLRKAGGNTAKFLHYHNWYCEVGTGYTDHFDHRLKSGESFEQQENEHFSNSNPYTENDTERFKKDVEEQEQFLKDSVGSLKKAYRVYNHPEEA